MIDCAFCGRPVAKRLCMELGDWLCPYCCGQYRVVKICCWRYCPFFLKEKDKGKERGVQG